MRAALHLNIIHFARAVSAEERLEHLEEECEKLKKENTDLSQRVSGLEEKMMKMLNAMDKKKNWLCNI